MKRNKEKPMEPHPQWKQLVEVFDALHPNYEQLGRNYKLLGFDKEHATYILENEVTAVMDLKDYTDFWRGYNAPIVVPVSILH